jgi:hypothetical protein
MKRGLRLSHFVPLAGFVVPTLGIGYGVVIPRSCIAGWNELTIGFAATVLGACLTYWAGLRLVVRDRTGERPGDGSHATRY